MSFHVGQKVVCVSVPPHDGGLGDTVFPCSLKVGRVYTVSWSGCFNDESCVQLAGVRRNHPDAPDVPFCAHRFRPITERKTGISIFERMLTPSAIKKAKRELV